MSITLSQTSNDFSTSNFSIEENGIRIIRKGIRTGTDTFVDFDDVGTKKIFETSRKIIWLILSILFLIFCITVFLRRLNGYKIGDGAEIFHLSFCLVLFALYLLTQKSLLYLAQPDNTNAIEFNYFKRHKQKVDNFIESLVSKRNLFLKTKYLNLDELLPYSQQYNNLVWLYNISVITKEELRKKVKELDSLELFKNNPEETKRTRIRGFGSNDEINDEDDN